ncbi:TerB family tellurite resistance protein [Roseiconus lacunae]|nr:TerB family tellurite resistance protein [Roseiconus lacunae]WRQ48448.1 TerB family tellurite resistance protein [Stieleria sp. HD01]
MNLTRTRESGQFYCPTCVSTQDYRLRSRRPFLTLYFIPVVPIGGAEQFVVCGGCREKWDPSVLTIDYQHPSQVRPDGETSGQLSADQFHDQALRSAILVVLDDGFMSEAEIESLLGLGSHLFGRPIDREELGELCSIAEQNKVRARNYVTSVSHRWNRDQKVEALQAMFLAATAEGELSDSQIKLLADMKDLLGLSDEEYHKAIGEALQWEHV